MIKLLNSMNLFIQRQEYVTGSEVMEYNFGAFFEWVIRILLICGLLIPPLLYVISLIVSFFQGMYKWFNENNRRAT